MHQWSTVSRIKNDFAGSVPCCSKSRRWWRKAMWDSYEERSVGLVFLRAFPHFEPLRADPVFQEIVRKIGLSVMD